MSLVYNEFGSLYGGVSQVPAEQGAVGYASEMINCVPTVNGGLFKRKPYSKVVLSEAVTYEPAMYTYEWQRGYGLNAGQRFSLQIGSWGLRVINIDTGKVYTEANSGLAFTNAEAKNYLTNTISPDSYSAITVKDSLFITNKTVNPQLVPFGDTGVGTTPSNRVAILFKSRQPINCTYCVNSAPYYFYIGDPSVYIGSKTTITISSPKLNTIVEYTVPNKIDIFVPLVTIDNYLNTLKDKLQEGVGSGYLVYRSYSDVTNGLTQIVIEPVDPTNIDTPYLLDTEIAVSITSNNPSYPLNLSDWYDSNLSIPYDYQNLQIGEDYRKYGYVWIKEAEPSLGHAFEARVYVKEISTGTISYAGKLGDAAGTRYTTTIGAATALKGGTLTNATVETSLSSGTSVFRIDAASGYLIERVETSDSFGDLASVGMAGTVGTINDLPKEFPYQNAVLEVTGEDTDERNNFWVRYSQGVWVEHYDPLIARTIDSTTMPHIIQYNPDDTFTISQYADYKPMLVGDTTTNPYPSFLPNEITQTPKIVDLFFFQNRLGFMTERGIVMSEVGNYGNFFKTTVTSLLDKDRIDGLIDTANSVRLLYASNLEDMLILFGDTEQFKIYSRDILTPKTVKSTKVMSYKINESLRPVLLANKLYFGVNSGNNLHLIRLSIQQFEGSEKNIVPEDMSTHVPTYVPSTVNMMGKDSENGMIFLSDSNTTEDMYVFKTESESGKELQRAWFKYRFQANIIRINALSGELLLMADTFDNPDPDDWILQDGAWDDDGFWYDTAYWRDSNADIAKTSNVLRVENSPYGDTIYLDGSNDPYLATVTLQKWVLSSGGTKLNRGKLKIKTIMVKSDNDSEFDLLIRDTHRNTVRSVNSKYTSDRRLLVYGDAENAELSIVNNSLSGQGFNITSMTLEGNYNTRARRL